MAVNAQSPGKLDLWPTYVTLRGRRPARFGRPMPVCPLCEASYPAGVRFCGVDGQALGKISETIDKLIGSRLGDAYELTVQVGRGAFGAVYAARHVQTPGEFAVKLLRSGTQAAPEQVARFRREVSILAKVISPHVVPIVQYGHDAGKGYYLVMPLLSGENLAERLARKGPLPLPELSKMVDHVTAALQCAHQAGVIHRDIKPENIYLHTSDDGQITVKLLDFGLAKLLRPPQGDQGPSEDLQTGPTQVLGSPSTMSPEQVLSQPVDARSDLYSFGVVLFEALTGQLPFDAESAVQLMRKQVYDPPPRPSEDCPWLSEDLEKIVLDLLAKRPSLRPQSAEELRQTWQAALPMGLEKWRRHQLHRSPTVVTGLDKPPK